MSISTFDRLVEAIDAELSRLVNDTTFPICLSQDRPPLRLCGQQPQIGIGKYRFLTEYSPTNGDVPGRGTLVTIRFEPKSDRPRLNALGDEIRIDQLFHTVVSSRTTRWKRVSKPDGKVTLALA